MINEAQTELDYTRARLNQLFQYAFGGVLCVCDYLNWPSSLILWCFSVLRGYIIFYINYVQHFGELSLVKFPSIHPHSITAYPPAILGRSTGGYTLDTSSVFRRASTDRKTTIDTEKCPIYLICLSVDCGRKPRYSEKTYASTGRTCKTPHRNARLGIEPMTFLLRCDSDNLCATVSPSVK